MKISFDNYSGIYRQTALSPVLREFGKSQPVMKRNYDEIKISSQAGIFRNEAEFERALASGLSREIREFPSEEKIDKLKGQVESGAYQVDTAAIAARILLAESGEA